MTEKEMIELFAKKQSSAHYLCPRCGKDAMADDPVRNALSRRASVHVCDGCVDPCPYGCTGGTSDEEKKVTMPAITPAEIKFAMDNL